MIDPQSRSLEWIEQASALIPNIADTALVEKAIRDAAKVAYLVRLIQTGNNQVKHYKPEMDEELAGTLIQNRQLNKLNGIKKISQEAFFYLLEIEKMAEQ